MKFGVLTKGSQANKVKPLGKENDIGGVLLKCSLSVVVAGFASAGYSMESSPTLEQLKAQEDQVVEVYSSSPERCIVETETRADLEKISSHSFKAPNSPKDYFSKTPVEYKDTALSYLARAIDAGAFEVTTPLHGIEFKDHNATINSHGNVKGVYRHISKTIELQTDDDAEGVLLHEFGHHIAPHGQEMRSQLQAPPVTFGQNALDESDRVILSTVVGNPGESSFATRLADLSVAIGGLEMAGLAGERAGRKATASHLHQEWLADSYWMYANYKVGGLDEVKNKVGWSMALSGNVDPDKEASYSHRTRIPLANLIETLVRYEPSALAPIKEKVIPDIIRESLQRSIVDQHMFDRSAQLNLYVETADGDYARATDYQNYRIAKEYFAREASSDQPLFNSDKEDAITVYDPEEKDIVIISRNGEQRFNLGGQPVNNPDYAMSLKTDFIENRLDNNKGLNSGIIDKKRIEEIQNESRSEQKPRLPESPAVSGVDNPGLLHAGVEPEVTELGGLEIVRPPKQEKAPRKSPGMSM